MKASVVAVGLSGGVDSAMAACLLSRAGHKVIGLTMKVWDGRFSLPDEGRSGCYGPGEERDISAARRVADRLGIDHVVVDLSREYGGTVVEYFRQEYLAGRTPNPCFRCNQRIKFGALWDKAAEAGVAFELFATGHYARIERGPGEGRLRLKRGVDRAKDQSYFLSGLARGQLGRMLLPLGGMTKASVKDAARKEGWGDLADKPESQDFIESRHYGVLFSPAEARPGPIVDMAGRVLGEHRGVAGFTVGQRKGLGLAGCAGPLYVVRIDACTGAVVVGPREALSSRRFVARDVSWADDVPSPARLIVQVRQQHKGAEALVLPRGPEGRREAEVVFDKPQMAVAPGQAAAFYEGDIVVGAGIIDTVGPAGS
ncbi:MAG: tRNA 2-thiouridine(34) synthase MnmA [Elusimicrobia bacterium]|nr:tRNA 2-thiouridine(34) synthase MnmA [Elusimicrobiota bacterium]